MHGRSDGGDDQDEDGVGHDAVGEVVEVEEEGGEGHAEDDERLQEGVEHVELVAVAEDDADDGHAEVARVPAELELLGRDVVLREGAVA